MLRYEEIVMKIYGNSTKKEKLAERRLSIVDIKLTGKTIKKIDKRCKNK